MTSPSSARDLPIIFSGPMVRALLDGRKTMTRRLAWYRVRVAEPDGRTWTGDDHCHPTPWQKVKPGDRLYVRETLHRDKMENFLTGERSTNADVAYYTADDTECCTPHGFNLSWIWRSKSLPSIHMPKHFSRLTLVVTAVKVERLQDISHDDAVAEGVGIFPHSMSAQKRFKELWDSLHGADAWAANPEVVAISFRVVKQNIDALAREAA